jgi:hypothetical protein
MSGEMVREKTVRKALGLGPNGNKEVRLCLDIKKGKGRKG